MTRVFEAALVVELEVPDEIPDDEVIAVLDAVVENSSMREALETGLDAWLERRDPDHYFEYDVLQSLRVKHG